MGDEDEKKYIYKMKNKKLGIKMPTFCQQQIGCFIVINLKKRRDDLSTLTFGHADGMTD